MKLIEYLSDTLIILTTPKIWIQNHDYDKIWDKKVVKKVKNWSR